MRGGLAVVTGGNRGIGRACAERLLVEGHRVLVTGRDRAALDRTVADLAGLGEIDGRVCDVTDEAEVGEVLGALEVDVLVANAGVDHAAPAHRTTLADWERVLAVNATGVFLTVRAVLPGMRERDHGRVIGIASVAAHHGVRYASAYAAAKHAALGFLRSVAVEVAGTGVTANAVCPGFVESAMTDRSVARIVEVTDRSEDEARRALEGMNALGRLVTPGEVAAAVSYLASEEAAPVNGQSLLIEGGGIQR